MWRKIETIISKTGEIKKILDDNKELKDAILELKAELKRYNFVIIKLLSFTYSDLTDFNIGEEPTTPKENLLNEEIEDLGLSDMNDLNYTEDNDWATVSVKSKELVKIEQPDSIDPFINEHCNYFAIKFLLINLIDSKHKEDIKEKDKNEIESLETLSKPELNQPNSQNEK